MKLSLRRTLPQSLGLLMLAGVLLWGQIVNAQHVHLDNHAPHECVSCQQLNSADDTVTQDHCFNIRPALSAPFTRLTTSVATSTSKSFSIRAPPTI